jgi:hypothetical protein
MIEVFQSFWAVVEAVDDVIDAIVLGSCPVLANPVGFGFGQ